MKKGDMDMTKGAILPQILIFALPLILGQLFQQLYNTFDTWCVGNFVGKNSFSAVGTVGSITNMLIGFAGGFSTGAGVVISQYYGAGDKEKVRKSVHTSILFMAVLSVALSILGVALTPFLIRRIKAPPEVAAEEYIYLTIYFSGITGLLLYNMGSAIFRAVGNSRLPFIFLIVSSLMNITLDLVFVIALKMGTGGVAYATIISQGASAILVFIALKKTKSQVSFRFRELRIDWKILSRIIFIGLPSAIQMAVTSFSNVFVQSYINQFGADVMGGWTAYNKVDQLLFLPMQCMGLAGMTFVAQNYGADNIKRAKRGADITLVSAVTTTLVLVIPIIVLAPQVVRFFINGEEVIEYGTLFLRLLSPFYVLCCFNQVYSNALRGIGRSKTPMYVLLFSFVLARQIYLYIVSNYISNTIIPIAMGYPFGWILCSSIITVSYLVSFKKEEKKLCKDNGDCL